jgi:hypothetical protein
MALEDGTRIRLEEVLEIALDGAWGLVPSRDAAAVMTATGTSRAGPPDGHPRSENRPDPARFRDHPGGGRGTVSVAATKGAPFAGALPFGARETGPFFLAVRLEKPLA